MKVRYFVYNKPEKSFIMETPSYIPSWNDTIVLDTTVYSILSRVFDPKNDTLTINLKEKYVSWQQ